MQRLGTAGLICAADAACGEDGGTAANPTPLDPGVCQSGSVDGAVVDNDWFELTAGFGATSEAAWSGGLHAELTQCAMAVDDECVRNVTAPTCRDVTVVGGGGSVLVVPLAAGETTLLTVSTSGPDAVDL